MNRCIFLAALALSTTSFAGITGYYRTPAIHADTIVFVAEEDLWRVSTSGGEATRLTTHPGAEGRPLISPDGLTVAYIGEYEGGPDIYTMPLAGGLPTRRTFEGGRINTAGWTPDGKLVYATRRFSTLPETRLVIVDLATNAREYIPLAQAADVAFDGGGTIFFTRLPQQGSQTKRYVGGTAENLWKFDLAAAPPVAELPVVTAAAPATLATEAKPLTADFAGTSASPMWWQDRLYFRSDRDGTMNLWSMAPDGTSLTQHTRHSGIEVRYPTLSNGRIAYQLGADVHVYDIASGADAALAITLSSDQDHSRDKWIVKPLDWATSAHLSPDGDRVVATARGDVFSLPRKSGRVTPITRDEGVRHREARFMPDGKRIIVLSDQSGEVELWTYPADGVVTDASSPTKLTSDGDVLRWEAIPSPDGLRIAHHDKNNRLRVFDVTAGTDTLIDEDQVDGFSNLEWSTDSKWLAYVGYARNLNRVIKIWNSADGSVTNVTTDRYDSAFPAWSKDGAWLYILSDRNLSTKVPSPWGTMQPEPYWDNRTKIYAIALKAGAASPFEAKNELTKPIKKDEPKKDEPTKEVPKPDAPTPDAASKPDAPTPDDKKDADKKDESKKEPPKPVEIDLAGIAERLIEVPVAPGNYGSLAANESRLFFMSVETPFGGASSLKVFDIDAPSIEKREFEVKTIVAGLDRYELSADGKAILIAKPGMLAIIDASAGPSADLSKAGVDVSGWTMTLNPRREWRHMFVEAWRLERDYFYDRNMHAVDWQAILDRYMPLVDRVPSRADLSDLIAQMVSELSALHIFVNGGDFRDGPDEIQPATLGGVFSRVENGWRLDRLYTRDPDRPELRGPLERPGIDVKPGDVITHINGLETMNVVDLGSLLRQQVGRQTRLEISRAGATHAAIVTPIPLGQDTNLRYHEWEITRRNEVERISNGQIGYVHVRAMGTDNMAEFAREFYSVYDRQGLIIDMRSNRGGNIDSWLLSRLLRKAWFYWQGRIGQPTWNMQYAFRGHAVVLVDQDSASDGEAFPEGFRRLGLGKIIGTRTWGGEIWLSSSNVLVDRGIATAAETGVYGPEGVWLIEGHGVDPDIVVDNLPHATFHGQDAQLHAAIAHLQQLMKDQPVVVPPPPKHPDKSMRMWREKSTEDGR